MLSSSKVAAYAETDRGSSITPWALEDLARLRGGIPTYATTHNPAQPDAAEQARLARERELQDARTAGYEAGRQDGERVARTRLSTAVAAAEEALNTIRTHEAKWQGCVAENIAALATAVARHIVGRELQNDPNTLAELVRRALTEFPIDQPVRIRIHPDDLSLLSTAFTAAGEPITIAPNRDVRWLADPRIQPGGCMVEGREHIIDGRIDTALERLYLRVSAPNA